MTYKFGDPHPTKPGWRFWCYCKRASGNTYPKWCSPEAFDRRAQNISKNMRKYYRNNKEVICKRVRVYVKAHPEVGKRSRAKYEAADPGLRAWSRMRNRCAKNDIPFNLDPEFFRVILALCPVLGIPMMRKSKTLDNRATVDRLIPSLGYVKGNVAWMSSRANRIKTDATLQELQLVAQFVENSQNYSV